jgi:molecular chaperone GrpE
MLPSDIVDDAGYGVDKPGHIIPADNDYQYEPAPYPVINEDLSNLMVKLDRRGEALFLQAIGNRRGYLPGIAERSKPIPPNMSPDHMAVKATVALMNHLKNKPEQARAALDIITSTPDERLQRQVRDKQTAEIGLNEDWRLVLKPQNIMAFRKEVISLAVKHGSTNDKVMAILRAGGVMTIGPSLTAAYLGINHKAWEKQLTGEEYFVPPTVIDTLNFLVQLDAETYGEKSGESVLDLLIPRGDAEESRYEGELFVADRLKDYDFELVEINNRREFSARDRQPRVKKQAKIPESTKPVTEDKLEDSEEGLVSTVKLQAVADDFVKAVEMIPPRAETDAVMAGLLPTIEQFRKLLEDNRKAVSVYEIIPIMDNFDLASRYMPSGLEAPIVIRSMENAISRLDSVLKSSGLHRMTVVGREFNPNYHEAVTPAEGAGSRQIIEGELRAGYRLNGRVVRVALVKVKLQ